MAMLPDTRHLTVVLAAGIYDSKRLHHSDPDYWRNIIDTNVIGAYNVLRTVLPGMRQEGYGRIILFSSVVPQIGVVGTSAYSTSKAALWGLAKSVSVENASKGITCNCVNLGYSDLGMGQDALSDAFKRDVINSIPSKRLCTGQEILQTVDYLMGTPYVTGTAIDISGGIV
jgi:acetoacetyl-CoA reductase/3-oxoacyl-[acyl-carrier protein] reductase